MRDDANAADGSAAAHKTLWQTDSNTTVAIDPIHINFLSKPLMPKRFPNGKICLPVFADYLCRLRPGPKLVPQT